MTPSTETTTLTAAPARRAPGSAAGHRDNALTGSPTPIGLPTQWTWPGVYSAALRSTSILIAEPSRDSLGALAHGLRSAGVGQISQAGSVEEVDRIVDRDPPGHLALVSLAFDHEAFRLIPRLLAAGWLRVVALAPKGEVEPIQRAMLAGASGVLRGHPAWPTIELPARIHELSPREIEVLGLVADGRSNKWIAEALALSALTVKSHLARISRKLGTGDRSHLVAIAMRAGIIE